jgi:hypothetical protein
LQEVAMNNSRLMRNALFWYYSYRCHLVVIHTGVFKAFVVMRFFTLKAKPLDYFIGAPKETIIILVVIRISTKASKSQQDLIVHYCAINLKTSQAISKRFPLLHLPYKKSTVSHDIKQA